LAQESGMPHVLLESPSEQTLTFRVGNSAQVLAIKPVVLNHFRKHQQKRWFHREAGGQLFARFSPLEVAVEAATGPRKSDFRTRTSYVPDPRGEQQEINDWHKKGLHYVGDWHSHPEPRPRPSRNDSESIRDSFRKSKHHLNGFLLIIVGTDSFPSGLYVSLSDGGSELIVNG
jgi:integrative and conjugative element protein (TIGR02256 family)